MNQTVSTGSSLQLHLRVSASDSKTCVHLEYLTWADELAIAEVETVLTGNIIVIIEIGIAPKLARHTRCGTSQRCRSIKSIKLSVWKGGGTW